MQAIDSLTYWKLREEENTKRYISDEKKYNEEIQKIYETQLDAIQKEIESFYGKYAAKEGITLAEAKKRVSEHDVKAFERKAEKYVKEKNFSKKANDELRLYNATMRINRLEMLKANLGLESIVLHNELDKFMEKILRGRTMEELERQAGILGKTVLNNAKKANAIVNGSFKVAKVGNQSTFSDRIWQYQDLMREDLGKLLQTGLIQGKNPRAIAKDLRKYWYGNDPKTGGGAEYCMERLLRTELARVQTEAQKESFKRNGFSEYIFIANAGCCDACQVLNGKHFKVEKMMPGENAPPIHPNDKCSIAAYEDDAEYNAWLDYLSSGKTTAEWNKSGRAAWEQNAKIKLNSSFEKSQNFKPVLLDKNNKISISYKDIPCDATRATGYNNEIYVSDKISLKPKEINYVNTRINKVANMIGAKSNFKMPRIIICDSTELPLKTVAAYTADDNTLRINRIIASKEGVLSLPKDGACHENHNSVFVHEMLHWSDAQKYIIAHGNADGYLESNIKEGKSNIDNLAKNGYNIYAISEYARKMLMIERYDEVWTEYRVTQILKG